MGKKNLTQEDKDIKQLRKYLRRSKQAIPGVICFGAIVLAILLVFDIFFNIRWWIYLLCLWIVPFGLIGDAINILFINRKLKRITTSVEQTVAADAPNTADRDRA